MHRKCEPTVEKPARRRETAAPARLGDERRLDLDEPAGDGGAGVAFSIWLALFGRNGTSTAARGRDQDRDRTLGTCSHLLFVDFFFRNKR